ncbi:hypothetical protein KVT40_007028 [Elsinoe batatas]|uniref:Uncharacterized protein n=1 Tax=Elsinoe batatas TaxID=2601811 RepID=A0A8K0PE67_9PEZI|nr:hypothetical protein KVT40_007028 [Elsinoe batatas]
MELSMNSLLATELLDTSLLDDRDLLASVQPVLHDKNKLEEMERQGKQWPVFATHHLDPRLQEKLPFTWRPEPKTIMAWLLWQLQNRKGRLDKMINLNTMVKIWAATQRLIVENCGLYYEKADLKKISEWILRVLPRRKAISTKLIKKPVAGPETVLDLINFLWKYDEFEMHPRSRLQTSFLLLVLLFHGLRPSEFLEVPIYAQSNEGLLYGDFELKLTRHPITGQTRWLLQVRLRNRKYKRFNEGKTEYHVLKLDSDRPLLCPVTQFLALAITDKALEGIESVDDLESVRLSKTSSSTVITCKKGMESQPIVRRQDDFYNISPDRIIQYDSFRHSLRELGIRAGYEAPFTAYMFRRGHGNILDKAVTAAERRQRKPDLCVCSQCSMFKEHQQARVVEAHQLRLSRRVPRQCCFEL